jgi:transposase InsO family protein/ribosomal protein L21E
MDDIIEKYYVEFNFPSANKFYKILKDKDISITKKEVINYINRQDENQLIKETHNNKASYGHITAMGPNEEWQIDIFVFDKYYTQNNGYKYMLCAVDIFTRKAYVEPMKTKNIQDTSKAIQKLITLHGAPLVISSDNDSAFSGDKFQAILKQHNIMHNTNILGDHFALGVIDRFARSLKTILNKMLIRNKSKYWLKYIDDVVSRYNDTPHAAILGMTPNEVTQSLLNVGKIADLNAMKNKKNNTVSDINEGDKVRINIKGTFSKGTEPTFSDKTYKVMSVNGKSITLDDGNRYKRDKLLLVPNETVTETPNVIREAKKTKKQRVILNREDISNDNLQRKRRDWRPTSRALETFE